MGFKKHNWLKYGNGGHMIEITIRDESGRKMDFFRCNNKEGFKDIARIIRNKYGFDFSRNINNQINFKDNMDKERDFLKED